MEKVDIYNIIYAARDFIKAQPEVYGINFRRIVDRETDEKRHAQLDRALVGVLFPLEAEETRTLIVSFVALAHSATIAASVPQDHMNPDQIAAYERFTQGIATRYAEARQQLEARTSEFTSTQAEVLQCLGEVYINLF